jgi:hypothetical protein
MLVAAPYKSDKHSNKMLDNINDMQAARQLLTIGRWRWGRGCDVL